MFFFSSSVLEMKWSIADEQQGCQRLAIYFSFHINILVFLKTMLHCFVLHSLRLSEYCLVSEYIDSILCIAFRTETKNDKDKMIEFILIYFLSRVKFIEIINSYWPYLVRIIRSMSNNIQKAIRRKVFFLSTIFLKYYSTVYSPWKVQLFYFPAQ